MTTLMDKLIKTRKSDTWGVASFRTAESEPHSEGNTKRINEFVAGGCTWCRHSITAARVPGTESVAQVTRDGDNSDGKEEVTKGSRCVNSGSVTARHDSWSRSPATEGIHAAEASGGLSG